MLQRPNPSTSRLSTLFTLCLLCFYSAFCPLAAQADESATPAGIDSDLVLSTRGIAGQLLNQLGQKLKAAMSADGPIAAVSVCKEAAPAIAKSLSAEHGVLITRVGTRVRNSNMGVPNAWQKEALAKFEARMAQGEKPADLEYWQVVDTGNGKRELHYAKAIAAQPQCLACHGQPQDIAAPLAEKIKLEYPNDEAVGYIVGKLRGAVVVTKPL
jgi:cytochrome c551/c552